SSRVGRRDLLPFRLRGRDRNGRRADGCPDEWQELEVVRGRHGHRLADGRRGGRGDAKRRVVLELAFGIGAAQLGLGDLPGGGPGCWGIAADGGGAGGQAGELCFLVVVVQGASEVEDSEDQEEQDRRNKRELDDGGSTLVAAERTKAPPRPRPLWGSRCSHRMTPVSFLGHVNVVSVLLTGRR